MYFQDIITTVFEPTLIKVGATVALSYGFLFGDFHSQAILAILMLMVFDTVLGVMATWYEGQAITSRKFSRVVQKGVVYFMSISAGYFTDQTTGIDIVQSTMIAFIGVTEFISILENMGRMGYQTPKKLLHQLKDFQSSK
jgi:toxin secretion/phage lysis holin